MPVHSLSIYIRSKFGDLYVMITDWAYNWPWMKQIIIEAALYQNHLEVNDGHSQG